MTLLNVPGLGSRKVHSILSAFPDITGWRELLDCNLGRVEGVSVTLVERVRSTPVDIGSRILEETQAVGARYIHFWEPEYPAMLKKIY
ncbi:MAG: hypothetical protein V3W14_00180, partial [Candidatus Neomarinimicrobiota bacterium]